jgi:hypothetical protein
MIFEQGRRSVLLRKAEYQRRWRERKKAREKEEKTREASLGGDRDLQ